MLVQGRYYYAPDDAPAYPYPHFLWSRRWGAYLPGSQVMGESSDFRHRFDQGTLAVAFPPAVVIPSDDCAGLTGLYESRVSLPLIAGVDERCWLEAAVVPPEPPMAQQTPLNIPMFSTVYGELTDSPISYDEATGCILIEGCLHTTGPILPSAVYLPTAAPSEAPPVDRYAIWVVEGGRAYIQGHEGGAAPLIDIPAGWIPRGSATGDRLEPSRIYDPGTGPIEIDAPLIPAGLSVSTVPVVDGDGALVDSRIFDDGSGPVEVNAAVQAVGEFSLTVSGSADTASTVRLDEYATYGATRVEVSRTTAGNTYVGALHLEVGTSQTRLNLAGGLHGTTVAYAIAGASAPYISADGWDVRGGLVFAVPDATDIETLLGLGSAAYEDTTAFDAAGTATAALGARDVNTSPPLTGGGDLGSDLTLGLDAEPGEAVASGNQTLSASAGTWVDVTDLTTGTLDSGVWEISAVVSGFVTFSAGASAIIAIRLYDATTAAAVPDTERTVAFVGNYGHAAGGSAFLNHVVTLAGSQELRIQAKRDGTGGPTFTSTVLTSSANGRSALAWKRIG